MEKTGSLKFSFHLWFLPSSFMFISSVKLPIDWDFCIETFHASSRTSHLLALTPKNLHSSVAFSPLEIGTSFLAVLLKVVPPYWTAACTSSRDEWWKLVWGLPRCTIFSSLGWELWHSSSLGKWVPRPGLSKGKSKGKCVSGCPGLPSEQYRTWAKRFFSFAALNFFLV